MSEPNFTHVMQHHSWRVLLLPVKFNMAAVAILNFQ